MMHRSVLQTTDRMECNTYVAYVNHSKNLSSTKIHVNREFPSRHSSPSSLSTNVFSIGLARVNPLRFGWVYSLI
ncbi:hypothetical protein EZS27_023936 [termite gut metagenome]|uniref:Uncharacterized protein n=1 Tax=termite gut metagenome TaxID=433724 RepID=A0A5J4R234_9ZZZZ